MKSGNIMGENKRTFSCVLIAVDFVTKIIVTLSCQSIFCVFTHPFYTLLGFPGQLSYPPIHHLTPLSSAKRLILHLNLLLKNIADTKLNRISPSFYRFERVFSQANLSICDFLCLLSLLLNRAVSWNC